MGRLLNVINAVLLLQLFFQVTMFFVVLAAVFITTVQIVLRKQIILTVRVSSRNVRAVESYFMSILIQWMKLYSSVKLLI